MPQERGPLGLFGGCCGPPRIRYLLLNSSGILETHMQALGTLAFGLMTMVNLAVLAMLVAGIFRGTQGRR